MVRLSAFFIACCMVLIAASVGTALHFRFGVSVTDSALVGLGVLCALSIYNAIAGRKHDRAEVSDQVSDIARGSGDLARQMAEFDRRLGVVENQVDIAIDRALSNTQPLAAEVEDLSRVSNSFPNRCPGMRRPFAGTKAKRTARRLPMRRSLPPPPQRQSRPDRYADAGQGRGIPWVRPRRHYRARFRRGGSEQGRSLPATHCHFAATQGALLRSVVAAQCGGEIVAAADFLPFAASASILPKLDGLSVSRCVQVVRRLLMKNRDVGLFCNLSITTLTDSGFPQLLEFFDANRAIAPSLVFEFTQSAVRAMGPAEHDSLAALA